MLHAYNVPCCGDMNLPLHQHSLVKTQERDGMTTYSQLQLRTVAAPLESACTL